MINPNPKWIGHIVVAAGLFVTSFFATRAFQETQAVTESRAADEHATFSGASSAASQSFLPGSGQRYSGPGASTARDFFERWQTATENQDDHAIIALIKEWAHTAPEAGIALALEENEPDLAWKLVTRWAGHDEPAAIAIAKTIPIRSTADIKNRDQFRLFVARKRLREEPEKLAALLSEFPPGLRSSSVLHEPDLGSLDPARQAAALEGITEHWLKKSFAKTVLSKWAQTDPQAALQWLKENLPDKEGYALKALLEGWAKTDPDAADQYLAETGSRDPRKPMPIFDFATAPSWPLQSEDDVRQWANSGFYAGSNGSSRSWKLDEVQAATAVLIENPDLAKSPNWHRRLADRWAMENPDAALEWSASLPPELQIEAAESALESWFQLDPKRAVAFTESLPASEFRGFAIEKVAEEWADTDPGGALEWTATLPPGAIRDAATGRIARRLRYDRPARAIEIARMIDDDLLRLDNLKSVIEIWSKIHPAKAETLVQEAELSNLERKAMLEQLSPP